MRVMFPRVTGLWCKVGRRSPIHVAEGPFRGTGQKPALSLLSEGGHDRTYFMIEIDGVRNPNIYDSGRYVG